MAYSLNKAKRSFDESSKSKKLRDADTIDFLMQDISAKIDQQCNVGSFQLNYEPEPFKDSEVSYFIISWDFNKVR